MITQIEKNDIIFVLSPHIDDGELGCGGTISKLILEKKEVHFIVFSLAEKSIPQKFPKNITKEELYQSMQILKIHHDRIHVYNFEVRTFPSIRQEILEILWKLNKEYSPGIIFTPSLNDLHQDHEIIAKESIRAFKNSTIFGYEEPWNLITFSCTVLSKLTSQQVKNKVEALLCYNSQKHRSYFTEEYFWNLAKARGTLVNHEYAEAFEVMRLIF